jgi:hypothetical protein
VLYIHARALVWLIILHVKIPRIVVADKIVLQPIVWNPATVFHAQVLITVVMEQCAWSRMNVPRAGNAVLISPQEAGVVWMLTVEEIKFVVTTNAWTYSE